MKNLKYMFLFLLLIPLNVDAKITLKCKEQAKPSDIITCTVNSDETVTEFSSELGTNNNANYFGASPAAGFNSTINRNTIAVNSTTGGKHLANITFQINPYLKENTNITLSLTNIKYKNGGIEKTQDEAATAIVSVQATSQTTTTTTTQSSKKVFTITLNSNNESNTNAKETCETTGTSCKIDLTKVTKPTKSGTTFKGWGNSQTCNEGSLTSYTAIKDATLYACWENSTDEPTTSPSDVGDVLYLKNLVVEGQEISFSKFNFDYNVRVLYEIESLEITAEAANEDVEVEINNISPLVVGENTIVITLSDDSGNQTSYTVIIERLEEGVPLVIDSNDATLKNVVIEGYPISFSPTVFGYDLEINYKTKQLNFTIETNDKNAKYEVLNNNDLQNGSIVKVQVTAENGDTLVYNFSVSIKSGIQDYYIYIILGSILLLALILLVVFKQKKNKINKAKDKPAAKSSADIIIKKPAATKKVTTIKQPSKPVAQTKPVSPTPVKPVAPQKPAQAPKKESDIEVLDL